MAASRVPCRVVCIVSSKLSCNLMRSLRLTTLCQGACVQSELGQRVDNLWTGQGDDGAAAPPHPHTRRMQSRTASLGSEGMEKVSRVRGNRVHSQYSLAHPSPRAPHCAGTSSDPPAWCSK
eukprot:1400157-Amphidinium_carterae.2